MKKKSEFMTAERKLADLLSRRDHSELELRQKLSARFESSEVEEAITQAKEKNWLMDPAELAERVHLRLNEKRKGALYIQNYLKQKGLPEVTIDDDIEMEKSRSWLESNLAEEFDFEKKIRFLKNRGFEPNIIRKVLNEKP